MYTVAGASFNPNIKLIIKNAKQTIQNDSAIPNAMNVVTAGTITNINARRRPRASDRKPLKILPNGWPMYIKLAAHEMRLKSVTNRIFCWW